MEILFDCEVCKEKFALSLHDADAEFHICPCCGRTRCMDCFIAADEGDESRDCCVIFGEDDEEVTR